jgi:pectate lyase
MLGDEGNEFKQWALEELTAFGKASYRKENNIFVPILTDGTNLEGYAVKQDGPLVLHYL